MNPLSDLSLNENAGAQIVPLSGITSGAANKNQTLTLSASSSNPGLVPVPTLNYASPNPTGSLSLSLVPNTFGVTLVTITVKDGAATNNLTSRSFTVTVKPVNQPPTLNGLSDLTLNENAGVQRINLSGITSGTPNENQTLTVSASSSDPSLVPNPTVSYTSPSTTGSLSFKPLTNAFGSALVTVTVNDGQPGNNLISRSFRVTINAVNQRPTLNPLSNLTLSAGVGWQTVNLSGITAGPPNEIQTLSLIATSSIPSLIPDPIVSYIYPSTTGSITFKPFSKAVGNVMLRVTVFDGQATNNTFHRSFTVTINPISSPKTALAAFASGAPQLLATALLQSDGSILVSAKPPDGGSVLETDLAVLQAWGSTNLTNWELLPVPLVLSNNAVWLRDYSATNGARRYYRLGNP